MSRPEFEPTAALTVSVAGVEATPGQPCRIPVTVTNTGESPTAISLAAIGIDDGWVHVPDPVGPLAAGQSATIGIRVTVPLGHPPARLTASVMARDDRGLGRAADVSIEVLDGSVVAASVEPPEARGGWRGRANVVLRNRGRVPVRVDLDGSSPDADLRIRISHATQVLEAGQQVRVPARFNAPRPVAGGGRRRPYAVRVRTSGSPLYVEGAFTQRAMLPPWMSKGVAVALVVALWVAVAVVGISSLGHHLNKSATQKAANNNPPAAAPAGPTGGGSGGGANGSSGGTGGTGGAGGGGAAGGTGGAGTAGAAAAGATSPSRLSGKVAASQPGGVTVTVTPTSLADAAAQTATLTASVTRDSGIELASALLPMGKLYGDALRAPMAVPAARSGPEALQTTTATDGSWAIAAITSPGYYLVSFSKPGYATASYVVNVTGNGQPVTVQSRLVPGDGYLAGTVNGPSGPLGGALITITDGTLNLTTRTPTVGSTGTWSVHGLSTPDTYLVTVTLPGYSTQTTLQTLGAGGGQGAVNFTMVPGQGSVGGTVVSSRSGQPVGGLTVTVSGASVSRTTTTTTSGAVGTYSLPDLPVPGTYALTISGPGYVTQTQQVSLQSGANAGNATVNATVTPSNADVTGVATSSTGQGLAGAGAVLSNQQNAFKTLTTSGGTVGSFDFGQVPPGQYVLSVTDYGYTTESAQVSVGPGQVQTVNFSLSPVPSQSLATATLQGSVQSLATSKAIVGALIQLDGKDTSVTTNTNGSYSIPNVGPGTHTVTAACPTTTTCQSADSISNKLGPGAFETTSVQATVALGSLSFASPILMPKLDQLSGVVIDGSGARVADPVVTLTDPQTHTTYPANPAPAVAPASQGGFEFDALPHGTYTLTVSKGTTSAAGTCGDSGIYETYTQSITMAIDTDTALTGPAGSTNASPILTIEPTYRVNTEYISASGGSPQPTSGPVTVTVTGVAGTPSAGFTATCKETRSQTVVVLPNSAQGAKFDVAFSYTDSNGVVYNAPGTSVTDQVNSATIDTVVLVPDITTDVLVTLSFPWRTPAGIVNCTVSVTPESGCPTLTQKDLPTTVTLSGQMTSAGGVIGPAAQPFTGSDQGGGVWKFPATSLAGLVPGSVTFGAQGGAFQAFSFPTTTSAATFTDEQFTLTPNGTAVSGTLSSPTSGTSISVAPAQAGLSVTVSPGSSNNIAWQESGRSAQQISPGIYTVTFSHSGYDSVVIANFQVSLCDAGAACNITLGTGGLPTVTAGTDTYGLGTNPVSLTAQFGFSVIPNYTAQSGLAYPTVSITNGSGTVVGSAIFSATKGTSGFPDLSITQAPYTITIAGPAFQTSVTTYNLADLPQSPTPSTVDVTPTLNLEGYFVGTVKGLIYQSASDLLGAQVTANWVSTGAGCTSGTPNQLTGSTGSDGSFTLINPAVGDGGVCPGSVYNVVVTDPGYADSGAFSVTVQPGANQSALDPTTHQPVPIELTANQIKVTFTVTKGVGGAGVGGVTVAGTSLIGRPAPPPTANNTASDGTITVEVDPTKYTFTFTEGGYAPLSEVIDYSVGEADQTTPVALSFDLNTVQGVVSTPGSCASGGSTVTPCPLGGAAVTLTNSTTGQAFTATSSTTDGSFSFAPPSLSIPDGTYQLQASLSGYQYSSGYQPSFATSSSLTTIKNVSLAPSPVRVTVTANSNFSGLNLVGDAVSLSPATPPSPPTCPGGISAPLGEGSSQTAQIAAGGQASISNVTPDYYDVTVVAGNLPAQPPTGLLVCPGTATSDTYNVSVGQITGTVVAPSASGADQASAFTVTVTPGTPASPTGPAQSLVVTCSTTPSGCTQGTYTSGYLTPGSYTVQAADGSSYTMPSEQITVGSSGPTTAGTLTAGLTPVTVTITVTGNKPDNSGLSVTLLDAGSAVGTHSTDSGGVVTFPSVTPDPGASFTVTVDDGGTTLAQSSPLTFSIGIGSGNISETVTVTPKPPPTTTTTTTTTTVAPSTTTTGSTTTTTTAPVTTKT